MAPSSATIELLNAYLEWLSVERGRSRATVDAYRRDLHQFHAWSLDAGIDPLTASSEHLDAYLASLRASGRAPASVARARASLR